MSQLQQVVAAIGEAQRNVKEQMMRISSFQAAHNDAIQQVVNALQGSTRGHDERLCAELEKSKADLRMSMELLAQAEYCLMQVSMM
jgi:hypothetical protein